MPTSSAPQRKGIPGSLTLVLVLLAISVFINYVDRGNLSIAAPLLKGELGISASQLGVLLSAFFWTYAFLQLFSGWLVDRLNVNWVFAGGFFLWSAATAATGIVHTFSVLLLLRRSFPARSCLQHRSPPPLSLSGGHPSPYTCRASLHAPFCINASTLMWLLRVFSRQPPDKGRVL